LNDSGHSDIILRSGLLLCMCFIYSWWRIFNTLSC